MNKIPLMLLLVFCQIAHGQKKIMVEQSCEEYAAFYYDYEGNTIEIDSLNQIPIRHQSIVNEVIKKTMTDFQDNITFTMGRIIDLEKFFLNDSNLRTECQYVLPKYQLFFELSDSTIGIKKYCFGLSLDQYAQVIRFDWSRREDYNKRTSFIDTEAILKFAIKYAKKKKYKTDSFISELKHDKEDDILYWCISFLQTFSGDEDNNSKTYKTILISMKELVVWREYDMERLVITLSSE